MKFLFFLFLNLIPASNACLVFRNITNKLDCRYEGRLTFCFIDNPLAKIERDDCNRNSTSYLVLYLYTIDDLETFFFRNAETVEKLVDILWNRNTSWCTIKVINASLPSRNGFRLDDQWLRDLLGRFRSKLFAIYLLMIFDHFPAVFWTETNLKELLGPKIKLYIDFNVANKTCWVRVGPYGVHGSLNNCNKTSQRESPSTIACTYAALTKLESYFSQFIGEQPIEIELQIDINIQLFDFLLFD